MADPSPCLAAALRFLKVRPRSRWETVKKLEQGGFSAGDIDGCVRHLEGNKVLDDARFARWWTEDRALGGKYGPLRVRQELEAKGLALDLIAATLAELYPAEREKEVLANLVSKGGKTDPSKLGAKLIRNGFDEELVMSMLDSDRGQA